jgi:hypothetical protein
MPFILSFCSNATYIVILFKCHLYWHFFQMPFILPFFQMPFILPFFQMPFILSFSANAILFKCLVEQVPFKQKSSILTNLSPRPILSHSLRRKPFFSSVFIVTKTFFICLSHRYRKFQNRLLKACCVPATSTGLPRVSFYFHFIFLLQWPFTVLIKQTRQAVHAVKQSIYS